MYVWPISPSCEISMVMPLRFSQQPQQVVFINTTSGIRAEGSHRPDGDRLIQWILPTTTTSGIKAEGSYRPDGDRLI